MRARQSIAVMVVVGTHLHQQAWQLKIECMCNGQALWSASLFAHARRTNCLTRAPESTPYKTEDQVLQPPQQVSEVNTKFKVRVRTELALDRFLERVRSSHRQADALDVTCMPI